VRGAWRTFLAALVMACVAVPATSASADVITVTSGADEYNDVPTNTGCTLREAVQAANTNAVFGGCPKGAGADEIKVPLDVSLSLPGSVEQNNKTGDLDVTGPLTINGADGPGGRAHISVGGIDRALDTAATLTLQDLEISGGDAGAEKGGAVYAGGQQVHLDRVFLHDNDAYEAGALWGVGGAVATVFQSTISHNTAARYGGAFSLQASTLVANESTISDNHVLDPEGLGGAVDQYDSGSVLQLVNSTVSDNSAEVAGGILFENEDGMSITVENSTIAANHDTATIAGETTEAGGIRVAQPSTDVVVRGSILAGNTVPGGVANCSIAAPVNASMTNTYNLEDANTCGFGATGTNDLVGVDPQLAPLGAYGGPTPTRALYTGSPAIGAIPAAAAICSTALVDQRGFPRPVGGACDIGAFEGSIARPPAGGGPSVSPPKKKCKKPKKKTKKALKKYKKCKKRHKHHTHNK
jgi:CSLREA domain-containing protein